MTNSNSCLVAFTLGPVQTFIESARSIRDLWTGSYLLSWLTYHAMRPILRQNAANADCFVFPAIGKHPLWTSDDSKFGLAQKASGDELNQLLSPCLPNRFLAEVNLPETESRQLAKDCEDACLEEWKRIGEKTFDEIRNNLDENWHSTFDWDLWNSQTNSFFEIQTAVLPSAACTVETYRSWFSEEVLGTDDPDWSRRWTLITSLVAAGRTIRHIPEYGPVVAESVPPKCSILGSYEQMGPGNLEKSADFWKAFARGDGKSKGVEINVLATRPSERFCAISLIKRFSWATAIAPEIRRRSQAQGEALRDAVHYPDTHTVAAAKWLRKSTGSGEDLDLVPGDHKHWNGQWLHWERPDQIRDERQPGKTLWDEIQRKKRVPGKERPPIYYAVLMLDGDKMGDKLQMASRERQKSISEFMSAFALDNARQVISSDKSCGTLIYSGGDDVLAVLPVETALECAETIQSDFEKLWLERGLGPERGTVSAGLVITHAKEDLRLALKQARYAEKVAKNAGRDLLTLTTCRGSGEYSVATMPWSFVEIVNGWVKKFMDGASDRWAYRLAGELTTWMAFDDSSVLQAELNRQINRSDVETRKAFLGDDGISFPGYVHSWQEWSTTNAKSDKRTTGEHFRDFLSLVQSASFIARGRDQ